VRDMGTMDLEPVIVIKFLFQQRNAFQINVLPKEISGHFFLLVKGKTFSEFGHHFVLYSGSRVMCIQN
jgi:hypothetical protein